MSEFNEFRQPSALAWSPEVSGTWLAYESQDTHRKQSVDAHKPVKAEAQPIVDVTSVRPGDSLNFSKDEKGYFFFKASGDDNYARHYFDKAQKWARLETLDSNGHRRIGPSYDLELQRKNVDQWLASQKPVEAPVQTPVQAQPSHLEVTPAFNNVEQPKVFGRPLLPDQYHHWSSLVDAMKYDFPGQEVATLGLFAGLSDKVGKMMEDQIGALHDYIEGTTNQDPKLRVQLATMMLANASRFIVSRNEHGKLKYDVTDKSVAGAYINGAIEELDKAIIASDSMKQFADYGRTNDKARELKSKIVFIEQMLKTDSFKALHDRPLPELLP